MMNFRRNGFLAVLAVLGTATAAVAKPHDIRLNLKVEMVSAIHTPTGCMATMEYHDGAFVAGFITDPLCLPRGVKKRSVPSAPRDYYLMKTSALTGR